MGSAFKTAAAASGLGKVRQVHRALNAFTDKPSGAILGGTTIGALFFATRSNWLAVVITIAAGALVTVAYANLVDLDWPRRIAVCDGGLVMDQWDGGIRPVAWADIISAGQVARPGPSVVFELVVQLADQVETVELGSYTARSALTRSILAMRPVPIAQWPRVVVSAAVLVLSGLAVWQVVLPRFVVREESELPSSSDLFSDACDEPGVAYTSAAGYVGPPPHPLLVVPGDVRWRLSGNGTSPWYMGDVGSIQLIACVERDGDDGPTGEICSYSTSDVGIGGRMETQSLRAGWYTITVYELRTRREVGSSRVLGQNRTCPERKLGEAEVFTTPTDAQLHEALDAYIERSG